jgi:hypothetical protein
MPDRHRRDLETAIACIITGVVLMGFVLTRVF